MIKKINYTDVTEDQILESLRMNNLMSLTPFHRIFHLTDSRSRHSPTK